MLDLNSIRRDDLIGAIHVAGEWHFCVTYMADWIMDMEEYEGCGSFAPDNSPTGSSEKNAAFVFRNNICTVDDSNVQAYIDYLRTKEISVDDMKAIIENKLLHTTRPSVLIDFDKRLFVNFSYFIEVEIHEYIPTGWNGIEGNPVEYLPDSVNIWPPFQIEADQEFEM